MKHGQNPARGAPRNQAATASARKTASGSCIFAAVVDLIV
jgi:hypothetical protein